MKKIKFLTLLSVLTLILSGCGGGAEPTNSKLIGSWKMISVDYFYDGEHKIETYGNENYAVLTFSENGEFTTTSFLKEGEEPISTYKGLWKLDGSKLIITYGEAFVNEEQKNIGMEYTIVDLSDVSLILRTTSTTDGKTGSTTCYFKRIN